MNPGRTNALKGLQDCAGDPKTEDRPLRGAVDLMRFVILTFNYDQFLAGLYAEHPNPADYPYDLQLNMIHGRCFGTADFYSHALKQMGHEAVDLIWNATELQLAWCREHRPGLAAELPATGDRNSLKQWQVNVLLAQVRALRPDVLVQLSVYDFPTDVMLELKRTCSLYVGQCAYPIQPGRDLSEFDLMLSSLPGFVDRFRSMGLRAELFRLGFDSRITERISVMKRDIPVIFIGGFAQPHIKRNTFLERIAHGLPELRLFGYSDRAGLPQCPVLLKRVENSVWGLDMFAVLAGARIVLNAHAPWADGYANNMRLFEATGMGACLVTENAPNITDYFEPGLEAAVYEDAEDCIETIRRLLNNESERRAMASAGRKRTLNEHTYAHRAEDLCTIVRDHLTETSPLRASKWI